MSDPSFAVLAARIESVCQNARQALDQACRDVSSNANRVAQQKIDGLMSCSRELGLLASDVASFALLLTSFFSPAVDHQQPAAAPLQLLETTPSPPTPLVSRPRSLTMTPASRTTATTATSATLKCLPHHRSRTIQSRRPQTTIAADAIIVDDSDSDSDFEPVRSTSSSSSSLSSISSAADSVNLLDFFVADRSTEEDSAGALPAVSAVRPSTSSARSSQPAESNNNAQDAANAEEPPSFRPIQVSFVRMMKTSPGLSSARTTETTTTTSRNSSSSTTSSSSSSRTTVTTAMPAVASTPTTSSGSNNTNSTNNNRYRPYNTLRRATMTVETNNAPTVSVTSECPVCCEEMGEDCLLPFLCDREKGAHGIHADCFRRMIPNAGNTTVKCPLCRAEVQKTYQRLFSNTSAFSSARRPAR